MSKFSQTTAQTKLKVELAKRFGEDSVAVPKEPKKPKAPDTRRKVAPYTYGIEERLKTKKKRFLIKIKEKIDSTLKTAGFEYPDVLMIAREVNVTLDHLAAWLKTDKDFNDRLAQIELLALQECRRVVFNGIKKSPHLALQILSQRAPEFKKEEKKQNSFTYIHVVSNVRSPGSSQGLESPTPFKDITDASSKALAVKAESLNEQEILDQELQSSDTETVGNELNLQEQSTPL